MQERAPEELLEQVRSFKRWLIALVIALALALTLLLPQTLVVYWLLDQQAASNRAQDVALKHLDGFRKVTANRLDNLEKKHEQEDRKNEPPDHQR